MSTNRYPGIASFEDGDVSSRLFFGREEESKLLLFSILSEYITVLFSKSGYGKTSLLQTDVFKKLRERGFYPIQVRFNKKDSTPSNLIIADVKALAATDHVNEIALPPVDGHLKDFFSKLSIWSPDDKLLNPVLVFDQFEEIFTLNHNAAEQLSFFEDLAQVANACKEGDLSLKMVFSIREDFLGNLEKLSVKIPSIFTNRFRLEALTIKSAEEAIVRPASLVLPGVEFNSPPFYYSADALKTLLAFLSLDLVEGKWIPSDYVEPVQLQIICSELETRVKNGQIEKTGGKITIRSADLGGEKGLRAILGQFYDRQLSKLTTILGLTATEVQALRNLIEKDLIAGNRRVPIDYDSIIRRPGIRKEAVNQLISNKLLREVTYESSILVEISHDSLIDPVLKSYEERAKKELLAAETEKFREKRRRIVLTALLALLVSVVWASWKTKEAMDESDRADQAMHAVDSLTNILKVKEAKAIPHPKPFIPQPPVVDTTSVVVEVPEPAPRPKPGPARPIIPRPIVPDTIAYTRIYYNNPAAFSSIAGDGANILTADSNGHGQLYDLRGELKETYDQPGGLSAFDYSVAGVALLGSQKGALVLADKYNNRWSKDLQHDGPRVTTATFSPQFGSPRYLKRILVCKDNGKVGLLDLYGRDLRTLESEDKVSTASFSADGNRILTGSADGVVRIWNTEGTEPAESLENKKDGPITSIALSADENRVIASSENGNVTVWDLASKAPLVTIPNTERNKKVNRVAFKKQNSTVYLGYSDGSIQQYSIHYDGKKYATKKEPWKYSIHNGPIQSMYFRESDNKLLSTSADGSARIWRAR